MELETPAELHGSDLSAPAEFSIREARKIVQPCFARRPAVYWTDMLVTVAIGYSFGSAYLEAPAVSLEKVVFFLISGFALFRAGSFIHEITHMRQGQMFWFRAAWNVLCGIPMLMPSFFYENDVDHKAKPCGSQGDGEDQPRGSSPMHPMLRFLLQVPLLPAYVLVRFLISPLSFVHPRVRNWFLEHASSFAINLGHGRSIPQSAPRRVWAALELGCCVWAVGMLAVIATGVCPATRLTEIYLLATFVLGLNYNRNLVAHHGRKRGNETAPQEQLEDAVTITGRGLLIELFFPLGLRYHALQHLFPSIPYHNLDWAHRRLMRQLPAGSPYHATVYASYRHVLAERSSDARATGAVRRNGAYA